MNAKRTISIGLNFIPIFLLGFTILLIHSPYYAQHNNHLITAITLDLVVTIPLVYAFIAWKNNNIPNITILSVFIASMIAASYIIPENDQSLLNAIKTWTIPIVEISVFTIVLLSARAIIKSVKNSGKSIEFHDAIVKACTDVLPVKIGHALATEISVIHHILMPKLKPVNHPVQFSYHQKSGILMVIGAFVGLIMVETIAVHLLLATWSSTAAWILTLLSIYTGMQMIALMRSMGLRKHYIDIEMDTLHLRYGIFCNATIKMENIASVVKNRRSLPEDGSIMKLSPLGILDNHNVILNFNQEQEFHGFYGIRKRGHSMALYIDELDRFIQIITERIHDPTTDMS